MTSLRALLGVELGPTSWLEVTQERIDAFAEATDDPQWIHVDPERAASGPFGATIAHGFLTLSLCVPMLYELLPPGDGMVVNYGVNRVRFPAPVPSGSRIRGRFRVTSVEDAPEESGRRWRRSSSARMSTSPCASPSSCCSHGPNKPCAGGYVCYFPRAVGVKRLLLVLVLALAASIGIVSDAAAGDFTDEQCPAQGADNYVCPAGEVGKPYSHTFQLKEPEPGCPSFAVTSGSLPLGLTMNSDGAVSGTPTEAGNFAFYVTVTYSPCVKPASDRRFVIPINPGVPKLTIGPEQVGVPISTVAAPFSLQMSSNLPDAKTWSVSEGALPAGLAIDATTGVISGTPTTAGTYGFTVRAVLPDQRSDTKALSIVVRDPVVIAAPANGASSGLPGSEVGVRLSALLSATGGTGTYTWSLAGGALPGGVVLGPTGAVEGRPTLAGNYRFSISATDTEGRIATYNGTLRVASRLAVSTLTLRPGTVGKYYQATLRTSGGVAPTAWRIQKGPLPRGILFDREKATFYGTPGRARTYRIGVQVVDALGVKVTKTLVLVVRAAKKLAKPGG